MKQLSTTLNRMPARTWDRAHVNEAGLLLYAPESIPKTVRTAAHASDRVIIRQDFDGLTLGEDPASFFVSPEMAAFIDGHASQRNFIRIPGNHIERKPIILPLHLYAGNPVFADDIVIDAEENSRAEVILYDTSENSAPVHYCGRIRIIVRRNARVKLVKVQMLGGEANYTEAIGALVHEGGQLDVIIAELGAIRTLSSCNIILEGEGSAAGLDTVYLGDGQRSLDMSYRVEHRGKKTVSNIRGKGILLEQSRKVFRDTLDFITGASGSKGREEESVLMLGSEMRNISVPLLLCGEDDIEGEHASTSGRPDDKILFYLMSRGIGESDAKKLLAQAAISSIVEKIPDTPIQDAIIEVVRQSIERGG